VWVLAVRRFRRALQNATQCRKLKHDDFKELNIARITAACTELDTSYETLVDGLVRADILLDRKSLATLAIWEPRTFKALIGVSRGIMDATASPPDGVLTRGML
jgi:large subunit ribosomal protein L20